MRNHARPKEILAPCGLPLVAARCSTFVRGPTPVLFLTFFMASSIMLNNVLFDLRAR